MATAVIKELFPQRETSLARVASGFHALSDETRLRIIDRLSAGERCVCDLADLLETGQSRLSFHLKILKDAGILTDRRAGRWVYYCLNPDVIDELGHFVSGLKTCRRRARSASCCE